MTEMELQIHVLFMDRVDYSISGTKNIIYFHGKKVDAYNTHTKYEKQKIKNKCENQNFLTFRIK